MGWQKKHHYLKLIAVNWIPWIKELLTMNINKARLSSGLKDMLSYDDAYLELDDENNVAI